MILVVFLYLSSFLIVTFTNAFITPTYIGNSCPSSLNFTINSTYDSNLKLLFSTLSSNATFNTSNGLSQVVFRSATAGQAPDEVYGLFLCRRDLNSTTCQDCVTYATRHVTTICPTRKLAIIWYDECHLRYSNQSFFSIVSQNPAIWMPNTENVTEPDKFDDSVLSLMNAAASKAAYSPDKFAGAKMENFRVNETLYGLVQCTQDLSSRDCFTCLRAANADLPVCCSGKRGGRVLTPSCNSRFELYLFFNESLLSTVEPAPAPEPPPLSPFPPGSVTESQGKRRQAVWIAIGTIIPTIIVLMLSGYFLPLIWRRYKEEKAKRRALQVLRSGDEQNNLREQHEVESQDFPIFPLGQILDATRHFSDENKLGEGGFGAVYKGVLADGKDIAVKRLSRTSRQGLQEFKNEVTLIAKLQHKNLVRLLGCCLEEKEFLLIYEFMPNKSLNVHLFDSTSDHIQLDWKRRMSIINGIARGLLYLHEDSRLKIIHRDLKTSNILLDHDMNPKISDFGMARIFGGNQNEANTNRVVGTYGYMAPEYAMDGIFSVKSDVYSFGVLLLEIMSGRKNIRFHLSDHGESLLSYAWKLWCEGHALELMDPEMVQSCVPIEFLKFIHIGLLCVQENPVDRPKMSSIVVMLVSDTVTLPKPTQPAFSVGRFVGKSDQASSTSGKGSSINEVTLSNVIPR